MSSNLIGSVFGHRPDKREFASDPNLPISTKFVGIEVEAENIISSNRGWRRRDLDTSLYFWNIDEDGSLRNSGAEFISRKLRGSDIKTALGELSKALNEQKITPVFSDRTSIHIHSDVRAMDYTHLTNFLSLYMFCEPFLFYIGGWKRKDNSYCVPFWNDFRKQELLAGMCTCSPAEGPEKLITWIDSFNKYDALNLYSISRKGTLEFRHHEGTLDINRIYNWAKIILTLFKISEELDKQELISNYREDSFRNNLLYRLFKNTEDQFPKEIHDLSMNNMLTYSMLLKIPPNLSKLKTSGSKKQVPNIEAAIAEINSETRGVSTSRVSQTTTLTTTTDEGVDL